MAKIHVLRRHYSEIAEKLVIFSDLLLSLTVKFYQEGVIDEVTKAAIINQGGFKGADELLSHVMSKIRDDDRKLPRIVEILRDAVALKEIAHKMDYIIKMNGGRG